MVPYRHPAGTGNIGILAVAVHLKGGDAGS